jgi:hypothetical protein
MNYDNRSRQCVNSLSLLWRLTISQVINCANLVHKNLHKLRERLGECAKEKKGFVVDDELLSQCEFRSQIQPVLINLLVDEDIEVRIIFNFNWMATYGILIEP